MNGNRWLVVLSAMVVLGTTLAGKAQAQYPQPPQQPYPYGSVPASPPSWSYDPYTSGLGPCRNWSHIDLATCGDLNPPTYGQPTYRPPTHPGVYY
jgi:hypothetical protein